MDLSFYIGGPPPRRTHQGGVQYRKDPTAPGGVRVFTDPAHRLDAAEMRHEFARQLPDGWTPSREPAEVSVTLAYPQRQSDRLDDDALLPHTERPDADNLVKSILDAMTRAGVWEDDAQVYELRVRKFRTSRPRWTVRVRFGGAGFLGGDRLPVQEIKRRLAERRRAAKKAARAADATGTLKLEAP